MVTKKYDLCVRVGSYESKGETKGRFLNVGAVLQGDKGPYILLNKTFNPAGVIDEKGGSSIIISMFEPKAKTEGKEWEE